MTFQNFVKENRKELDDCIKGVCPNIGTLNDTDRKDWVNNDEGLYNWARREGVRI